MAAGTSALSQNRCNAFKSKYRSKMISILRQKYGSARDMYFCSPLMFEVVLSINNRASIEQIRGLIKLCNAEDPDFINKRDWNDTTLLTHAILSNEPQIIDLLLELGADPNLGDWSNEYDHPLFLAIELAHYQMAIHLCPHTNPKLTDILGQQAIHILSESLADESERWGMEKVMKPEMDKLEMLIKEMVRHGHDINALDGTGRNVLFWAVWRNQMDLVHLLLENDIDVNHNCSLTDCHPKKYGITIHGAPVASALELAVSEGNVEMCAVLLNAGAKLSDETSPRLYQILCMEFQERSVSILDLLLKHGLNANIGLKSAKKCHTLLSGAILFGRWKMARLLVDHGAFLDTTLLGGQMIWDLLQSFDSESRSEWCTEEHWRGTMDQRIMLFKHIAKVQTERNFSGLVSSEMIQHLNVPLHLLKMIASPLDWY